MEAVEDPVETVVWAMAVAEMEEVVAVVMEVVAGAVVEMEEVAAMEVVVMVMAAVERVMVMEVVVMVMAAVERVAVMEVVVMVMAAVEKVMAEVERVEVFVVVMVAVERVALEEEEENRAAAMGVELGVDTGGAMAGLVGLVVVTAGAVAVVRTVVLEGAVTPVAKADLRRNAIATLFVSTQKYPASPKTVSVLMAL